MVHATVVEVNGGCVLTSERASDAGIREAWSALLLWPRLTNRFDIVLALDFRKALAAKPVVMDQEIVGGVMLSGIEVLLPQFPSVIALPKQLMSSVRRVRQLPPLATGIACSCSCV